MSKAGGKHQVNTLTDVTWIQLCHAQKIIANVRFTDFTGLSKRKHHIFQDNKKSTKNEKSAIKRRTVKQSFIHITWRKINVMLQWLIKKKCVIQCQTACHYTAVQSKEYKYNTIKCQDVSHSFVCDNKHSSPEMSSYFRTIRHIAQVCKGQILDEP